MARVDGIALALLLSSGCFAPQDDGAQAGESFMYDDFPSTNCQGGSETGECRESEESGAGSSGGDDECRVSTECGPAEACIAPFDGERGEFACVPGCIGIMDDASWCGDATACCDAGAICTLRGYCVAPEEGSSGSGSGGSDGTG